MMARPQNSNTAPPGRQCSSGHATGLSNPDQGRGSQRRLMMKVDAIVPDGRSQCAITCKASLISMLADPVKSTAKYSNPHRLYKPKQRAYASAVSSTEACPTPAKPVRRNRIVTAGVRQPLTEGDIPALGRLQQIKSFPLEPDLGRVTAVSEYTKNNTLVDLW